MTAGSASRRPDPSAPLGTSAPWAGQFSSPYGSKRPRAPGRPLGESQGCRVDDRGLERGVMAQESTAQSGARDIHAIVVDPGVVAAMRRQGAIGAFCSSRHPDDSAESVLSIPEGCRVAIQAAKAMYVRICGADRLLSNHGSTPPLSQFLARIGGDRTSLRCRCRVGRRELHQGKRGQEARQRSVQGLSPQSVDGGASGPERPNGRSGCHTDCRADGGGLVVLMALGREPQPGSDPVGRSPTRSRERRVRSSASLRVGHFCRIAT